MKNYKLTIPKPCHEGWGKMTPNEKGRFCDLCSKTVVDFTKKSEEEIKDYLLENRGKRVCGHFKRSQLDSLVIQIPDVSFQRQLSFQKIFILALLLAMGTTLFSCKTEKGKTQKIEKVELIDSVTKQVLDTLQVVSKTCSKDSISTDELIVPPPPPPRDVDVVGDLPAVEPDDDFEVGELVKYERVSFFQVEIPPKFNKTDSGTNDELKKLFNENIKNFFTDNFNESFYNDLDFEKGTYRIIILLTINDLGELYEIRVRSKSSKLSKRVEEMLTKLPQFIPGKQNDKAVVVSYVIPIKFSVE